MLKQIVDVLTFQLQRLESLVLKPKKQMTQQYFCMVMYYLFTDYFCWLSGPISHLIHLTCEYMTSLFVPVTDHLG